MDLETTTTKIDTLNPHHRNPRRGNIDAIAESLSRLGQYRPIVVNAGTHTGRPNEILAGNHTWEAARKLGWETIQTVKIDVDEDTASRVLVADNRTSDLATNDDERLAAVLTDISDLEGTGYSDEDLDDILALQEEEIELPPQPTNATWAETEEETGERSEKISAESTLSDKGISEIVLILRIEEKEDFIRDLDAISKHMGGTTRSKSAARAARIALTVLDVAETNADSTIEWKTLLDIADTDVEKLSA